MGYNGEHDSNNKNIHMSCLWSANIISNGTNRCGNAQYHCKDYGTYRVLKPTQAYSEAEKATVLRAGLERYTL